MQQSQKFEEESNSDEKDNFKEEEKSDAFEEKNESFGKVMILEIMKRMRVLMMEMLMSERSFLKHIVSFLYPLIRVKLWEVVCKDI